MFFRDQSLIVAGLAMSALASTLLLILVGSIVRVTGNGLGCPDWPLCFGQAIPPAFASAWVEFSHRFLAAATTAQVLLLALLAWRNHRSEKWIVRPALAVVGLLAAQITFGGIHVILELPAATGWIHTGLAMLIVGLLAVVWTASAPGRKSSAVLSLPADARLPTPIGGRWSAVGRRGFASWLSLNAAATYLLLLTGSYVTRSGASLACPTFPLCGSDAPVLSGLIAIHMLHRYTAFGVALLTLVTVVWLLVGARDLSLERYAWGMLGLLVVQVGLGIANVLLRLPMWSRALHLTVGAVFWVGFVVLWTLTYSDWGREATEA